MLVLKGGMDYGADGSDHGSAAKGSAIDLEFAGSGLVSCCFPFPPPSSPCVVRYLVFQMTSASKGNMMQPCV